MALPTGYRCHLLLLQPIRLNSVVEGLGEAADDPCEPSRMTERDKELLAWKADEFFRSMKQRTETTNGNN